MESLTFLDVKLYLFPLSPDNIPEDLRDPFYTDQYEQEHIKPPVIRLLLSCELYCRVCGLILKGDQVASLQSHLSVIQALSRKGIYVMESDDTPVTESDLGCMPIKMVSFNLPTNHLQQSCQTCYSSRIDLSTQDALSVNSAKL